MTETIQRLVALAARLGCRGNFVLYVEFLLNDFQGWEKKPTLVLNRLPDVFCSSITVKPFNIIGVVQR